MKNNNLGTVVVGDRTGTIIVNRFCVTTSLSYKQLEELVCKSINTSGVYLWVLVYKEMKLAHGKIYFRDSKNIVKYALISQSEVAAVCEMSKYEV